MLNALEDGACVDFAALRAVEACQKAKLRVHKVREWKGKGRRGGSF